MMWIAGLLLCDERNEILDATVLSAEHPSMHKFVYGPGEETKS
jgi:hypothetical protein